MQHHLLVVAVLFLCAPQSRAEESRAFPESSEGVDELTFESVAFGRTVSFCIVLPAKMDRSRSLPVLFLLHSQGGNHRTLVDNPETFATLFGRSFLIVTPSTGNGWWVNSVEAPTARYEDMLVEVCVFIHERFVAVTDDTPWAIADWSMGGLGAQHTAIAHPEGSTSRSSRTLSYLSLQQRMVSREE